MNIKVLTAPTVLPVSVAEVKTHLRIDISADDADIEKKIKAVLAYLDPPLGTLGRAMISQTLQLALEDFPRSPYALPFPPVQLIASVKYYDLDDVQRTISSSNYILKNDTEPALLILKDGMSWPTDLSVNDPYPVKIAFKAGYGDAPANVPEMIRLWIMMTVGVFYNEREHSIIGQTVFQNEFSRRLIDNFRYHRPE